MAGGTSWVALRAVCLGCSLAVTAAAPAVAAAAKSCPADSVTVGDTCIDKFEASVWQTTDAKTIKKIQRGKVQDAAELGQATQRGAVVDDYGTDCPDTGNGCTEFYAVSIPGVTPSRNLTWFQAAAACRNAGKRLPFGHEYVMAALGTPDPGTDNATSDCNVASAPGPVATGSRSLCVSDIGAFDLVGNLWEWVAEWGDVATTCAQWPAEYGDDVACVGGASTGGIPGAMLRGGGFQENTDAGPFATSAHLLTPSVSNQFFGFRCARNR